MPYYPDTAATDLFYRDECSSKGGVSAGTCANGFGVCCTCKSIDYQEANFVALKLFACLSSIYLRSSVAKLIIKT